MGIWRWLSYKIFILFFNKKENYVFDKRLIWWIFHYYLLVKTLKFLGNLYTSDCKNDEKNWKQNGNENHNFYDPFCPLKFIITNLIFRCAVRNAPSKSRMINAKFRLTASVKCALYFAVAFQNGLLITPANFALSSYLWFPIFIENW